MSESNVFSVLNAINCNEHTESKNGLTYLSWAWAWAEVKKAFPDAVYTIYENEHGWNYHTDGRTCWVKTGVTINELEHIEYLPVMDYRNKSISAESVTSFDVNKTIQRSLTKACARHGLGLYIYAGEDLPEQPPITCKKCGVEIVGTTNANGKQFTAAQVAKYTNGYCQSCHNSNAKPKTIPQEEPTEQPVDVSFDEL